MHCSAHFSHESPNCVFELAALHLSSTKQNDGPLVEFPVPLALWISNLNRILSFYLDLLLICCSNLNRNDRSTTSCSLLVMFPLFHASGNHLLTPDRWSAIWVSCFHRTLLRELPKRRLLIFRSSTRTWESFSSSKLQLHFL